MSADESLADRYGGWALITGASSGIGRAMAGVVAAGGMPCAILSHERDPPERGRDEGVRDLVRVWPLAGAARGADRRAAGHPRSHADGLSGGGGHEGG